MSVSILSQPLIDDEIPENSKENSSEKHLNDIKNILKLFELMRSIKVVDNLMIKPALSEDNNIEVCSLTFNSKYLVLGYNNSLVSLLNIDSKESIEILKNDKQLTSIECGKKTNNIAIASDDGIINYWEDIEKNKKPIEFEAHDSKINSMDISIKNTYLASCSDDDTVKIWKIPKFEKYFKIIEEESINKVLFTTDEANIIIGSSDNYIKVLDINSLNILHRFQSETEIISLAFTANTIGKLLASSYESQFMVWDLHKDSLYFEFSSQEIMISNVAFSLDGKYIAAGFQKESFLIRLWNLKSKSIESEIDNHNFPIKKVFFSQDKKFLVGIDEKEIILQKLECKEKDIITTLKKDPNSMALNSDYTNLAIACEENKIEILKFEDLKVTESSFEVPSPAKSLCFGNTDKLKDFIIYGLKNGNVFIKNFVAKIEKRKSINIYEQNSTNEQRIYEGKGCIIAIALCNKDDLLAISETASFNITIYVLDGKKKTILSGHKGQVTCFAFYKDNEYLLSGSNDKSIIKWELKTLNASHKFRGHDGWVTAIAVYQDFAASGSTDNTIIIWNLKYSRQEYAFNGHTGKITSVGFSEHGDFLVSGSFDNFIKVWNLKNKTLEYSISAHSKNISSVIFYKSMNLLISSSNDRTVKLWNFSNNQDIKLFNKSKNANEDLKIEDLKIDELIISPCKKYAIIRKNKLYEVISKFTVEYDLEYYDADEWECYFDEKSFIVLKRNGGECIKVNPQSGENAENETINSNQTNDLNQSYKIKFNELNRLFESGYQNVLHHKYLIAWLKQRTQTSISVNALNCTVGHNKYTGIHFAAYKGLHSKIKELFKNPKVPLKADIFGYSPIRYSIERQNHQCTDLLIKYLITLSNNSQRDIFIASLHAISKDLPLIIRGSSRQLQKFFNVCLYEVADHVYFGETQKSLPIIILNSTMKHELKDFTEYSGKKNKKASSDGKQKRIKKPLLLKSSRIPFDGNFYIVTSFEIVESLIGYENEDIFRTEFIQYIIQYNWNDIEIFIWIIPILQLANVLAVYFSIIFFSNESIIANAIVMILTVLFAAIEITQIIKDASFYFTDFWNYIDLARVLTTGFFYCSLSFWDEESYGFFIFECVIMLFSLIRGISVFRVFESTRYYIRLIFISSEEIIPFMCIFVYSVVSFGVMNIIAKKSDVSLQEIFYMPFAFTVGVIDIDQDTTPLIGFMILLAITINIIIMLNMIISILGDCFDEFQYKADIYNYKEMISVIYEFKCIRRCFGSRESNEEYYHVCIDAFKNSKSCWRGKVLNLRDFVSDFKAKNKRKQNELMEKIDKIEKDKKDEKNRFKRIVGFFEETAQKIDKIEKVEENRFKRIDEHFEKIKGESS
ncbi:hypothetical protein SteCoe_12717 [Stentor coeruleus]|uniref:Uncharacterized protein n=1 Tax=Stentor coeruleus TaxID=5963 RepID=A0A1R2CA70_9CILI|nr:hypothetical protein SteCoe_12717 [Stentor coeruleus]